MREVLIIGSGIAGMSCAIACAEAGCHVMLASPFPSERAQSVMAAGGINAVLPHRSFEDSVQSHIADTLEGGCHLAGERAVTGLCNAAPDIIAWLESLGTVFSRTEQGEVDVRAFGGQTHRHTCYCGASTGKQIVNALTMHCRKLEGEGKIRRRLWACFHSGLISDGTCYGALLFDEQSQQLEPVLADFTVVATGGQNTLFGKVTGSTLCDGYAAARLFQQGAKLKNLEFIQFHPTTMDVGGKMMLISEAARGEGGRLFYEEDGKRVYFMEERFGERGNLMPRDIVAREMHAQRRPVYLDVTALGKDRIDARIPEVRDLCWEYGRIDIARTPIPVEPATHFFMGGLAVHLDHESSIDRLFAIGECASMYHGANRLGGNSLLAAIYGGQVAAGAIASRAETSQRPDFEPFVDEQRRLLAENPAGGSEFGARRMRDRAAKCLQEGLGVVRDEAGLNACLERLDRCIEQAGDVMHDSEAPAFVNYGVPATLVLGKAAVLSALARRESRGAHYRSDYPEMSSAFQAATIVDYHGGGYRISYDTEGAYES